MATVLEHHEKSLAPSFEDLTPIFEELARSVQAWMVREVYDVSDALCLQESDVKTWLKARETYRRLDSSALQIPIDLTTLSLRVALHQIWIDEFLHLSGSAFFNLLRYGVRSPAVILRELLQKLDPLTGLILMEWEWEELIRLDAAQAFRAELTNHLHQAWGKATQKRQWFDLAEAALFLDPLFDPQVRPSEEARTEIAHWLAEQWPLRLKNNPQAQKYLRLVERKTGKSAKMLWHEGLFLESFILSAGQRKVPEKIFLGKGRGWVKDEDGKKAEIAPGELGPVDYARWISRKIEKTAIEILRDWSETQRDWSDKMKSSNLKSYEEIEDEGKEAEALKKLSYLFSPDKGLEERQAIQALGKDLTPGQKRAFDLRLAGYDPREISSMLLTVRSFPKALLRIGSSETWKRLF